MVDVEGMDRFEDLPAGFGSGLSLDPSGSANFGATPPPRVYVDVALAILQGAPTSCRPVDVAYYLADLREGRLPEEVARRIARIADDAGSPGVGQPGFSRFFAYDWERNHYFNPLVVALFRGNALRPYEGDRTPWCAAFVNWCISRSRVTRPDQIVFEDRIRGRGTGNASSGSFRCWADDARGIGAEGDVVVWARRGTVSGGCPTTGPGHVAFLTGVEGDGPGRRYRVVGGNQGFKGTPSNAGGRLEVHAEDVAQAVSRRRIGPSFGDLSLHSIRTAAFLR
jgi:hypothetical protein